MAIIKGQAKGLTRTREEAAGTKAGVVTAVAVATNITRVVATAVAVMADKPRCQVAIKATEARRWATILATTR